MERNLTTVGSWVLGSKVYNRCSWSVEEMKKEMLCPCYCSSLLDFFSAKVSWDVDRAPDVDSKAQKFQIKTCFLLLRPKWQQRINCWTFLGNCIMEHSPKWEENCAFARRVHAPWQGEGKWWRKLIKQVALNTEWMYWFSQTTRRVKAAWH